MRSGRIALAFLLLSALAAQAEEEVVEVRAAVGSAMETAPGKVVTAVFRVTNGGAGRLELAARVSLPSRWRLLTNDLGFSLEAEGSEIRLVSFLVPAAAPAGSYALSYAVERKGMPETTVAAIISVKVLPVSRLAVRFLEAPDIIIAGEEYRLSFYVINEGNGKETVALSAESPAGFPVSVEPSELTLAAGESAGATVTVCTGSAIRQTLRHIVTLRARLASDASVSAMASGSTEIVPLAPPAGEAYHTLPVLASQAQGIHWKDGELAYGLRPEISGDGSLDEEGREQISFLFRPPSYPDPLAFADPEEYRASLRTGLWSFGLGDGTFSLTSLTEDSLWARGVEGSVTVGNLALGGFAAKPKAASEPSLSAAFAQWQPTSADRIGLALLGTSAGGQTASIFGRLDRDHLRLQFEYARSPDDGAYLLECSSEWPQATYGLKILHGGSRFPGDARDVELIAGTLAMPLGSGLSVTASLRQEKHNLASDASQPSAPLETIGGVGLEWKSLTGIALSIGWQDQARRDMLPSSDFDARVRMVKLGIGATAARIGTKVTAEITDSLDLRQRTSFTSEKYAASLDLTPGRGATVKGYLAYEQDGSPGSRTRSVTAGLDCSLRFPGSTALGIHLQSSLSPSSLRFGSQSARLELSRTFHNGHFAGIQAGWTAEGGFSSGEGSMAFTYRIPLDVPVARKRSVGVVAGHVFDEESGAPIPGAILRLGGLTAVSGPDGTFRFPALSPGAYYLRLETARLGYDRIASRAMPLAVTVASAGESTFDIGITRAASLSGEVAVFREVSRPPGEGAEAKGVEGPFERDRGLADALIELTNGTEVKRALTDAQGRFTFAEIRPGRWRLTVSEGNLPDYHFLERPTTDIDLAPGDAGDVSLRVLSRKRQIRIIDEGAIMEEGK